MIHKGTWSDWIYCSQNYFICGLNTQIEPSQGGGDDTSLNNIDFKCCFLN